MTRDVIQAAPSATLKDIAQLMTQHQSSYVVITETVEDKTFPLGIVTEGDIVQFQTLRLDFEGLTAEMVMSSPVFCSPPTLNLWQAHQRMLKHRITHLVITHEDGRLAGILTQTTILNTLNPVAMAEMIDLLQEQVNQLETEKLQLLESRNAELSEAVKLKTADLEQQNEFEHLLADINNRVRSSLDFNTVVATTTSALQEALKIDRVFVYRFNSDWSGNVVVEAVADARWALLNREFFDPYFQQQAADLYQPTMVRAIANIYNAGLQDCYIQFLEQLDVKSMLVAAITQEDGLWGLLILQNCDAFRCWHEREVDLLRNVSSQLAIALRQASTHEALQQELATRQRTELLLRESEQRYASLAAVIPVVIFRTNLAGDVIYFNERWTELTGMSQQETLGWGWLQSVYSDDQQPLTMAWQQAIQAVQPFQYEYRLRLFDGSIRWVYVQAQPEWSVTGQVCGYAGSLTDISDRKQAELALQESEQRYVSLAAVVPVVIFRTNASGLCVYINDYWTKITGISYAETLGQGWVKGIHPDDCRNVLTTWQQAVQRSQSWQQEFRVRQADGSGKWVYGQAKVEWDAEGNISGYVGSLTDIGNRKQAEIRLQEAELKLRSTFEQAAVGMALASPDGYFIQVNQKMGDLLDYSPEELIGQHEFTINHPDYRDENAQKLEQLLQGDIVSFGGDKLFLKKDSTPVWVHSRVTLVRDAQGNPLHFLSVVKDISDRKQVETELKATSQRLQEAQRIAQLGNWELDLQTNTLHWSDEVFCIFEIDQSQFGASYEAFLDAIHPDDREIVNQAHTQHLENGEPYSIVHRLLMSDGRIKYVQEHCETIRDSNGKAIFSRGTVLDITSLKEAELKRQYAEASLRQIVEGTAAVTDCDFFQELVQHIAKALDVRYTSISEAKSDGFSILAFCADGQLQTIDNRPYDQLPCCVRALQDGQWCHPDSLRQLYPDNELFQGLNTESYLGIGLRNSAGEPIGNLCVMHDGPLINPEGMSNLLKIFGARAGAELERYQTARQLHALTDELEQRVAQRTTDLAETVDHLQAEMIKRQTLTNQLQQSQAQLHDLFDSANDMIQSVSLIDGSFEFVNRAWLDTLGYTVQDLETLTIFDVLHPDCQQHCKELMQSFQIGQMQSLEQVEISFVAKDGRIIEAEGNVNCRIVNGKSAYTRGIFRDISDRKKAEAEIINALEQERELNEMKSRFVSNTSHEFRTPLTVISSNAELLKLFGDKLNEAEKQKCLETILNYVDHTTELIDDVLIVSRAEAGKIDLNPKRVEVIEFSQQLLQTIGLSAPNHHFDFVVQDTRPQPQPYGHTAQLDGKIIQQSLTNLLTNAIKYSPEGSTITFQVVLLNNAIEFRVIDEGLGIPKDDQKYLFEPFHRATNVGTIQGTGLGLSIVKHLITVHQGSIQVTSTPGAGSCFTATIPTQW
ncbi:MAG: PAS domain S-box protein [Cyanobacteria bacterium P01_F01_bin.150]